MELCRDEYRDRSDRTWDKLLGGTDPEGTLPPRKSLIREGQTNSVHEVSRQISRREVYNVIRGGCWWSWPDDCRSARRQFQPSTSRHDYIGLRVALVQLDK